jgi:hypothetical protein
MRRTSASLVFACPAGRVTGKTDGALDLHSRKRHSEHQLVVLFGLPPPGSTQVLTQNLVIRRGAPLGSTPLGLCVPTRDTCWL